MKLPKISATWVAASAVPFVMTATAAHAQSRPAAPPLAEISIGLDESNPLGSFDLFLPFFGGTNYLFFGDARASFGGEDEVAQASLGIGYRAAVGETWTLGLNGYYDYLNGDYGNDFHQLGFGVEALSRDWEIRANAYLPIGDIQQAVASLNAAVIESGQLMFRAGEETAMRGFDGEIGYRLPVFAAEDLTQLKVFAGGYWYTGDRVEDVPGVSARIEFSQAALPHLGNGSRLTLVAGATYDEQRDFGGTLLARLRIPLGDSAAMKPDDLMYRRVERADEIRTYVGSTGKAEAAILEETGGIVGQVITIDGSDSAAGINSELAAAGDNALVLASGTINLNNTLQLGTGSVLTSGARSFVIRGASTGGTTIFNAGGASGTLNGTNSAVDVVAMGSGSTVENIAITGGRDGISATGVSNLQIRNVAISNSAGNAISASGVSNLQASGITISGAAGSALALQTVSGAAFSNVSAGLTGGSDGITADGVSNLQLSNVSVSGSLGSGLVASAARGLTVDGLSLSGVTGSGISLTDVTGAQFSNVGISAAGAPAPLMSTFARFAPPSTAGLLLSGVDSVTFSNVGLSLDGGDAVSLSDTDNVQLANVVVSGEAGNAFTAFGASGLNVNGFSVASVTGNGISLTDVDGAQFANVSLSLDGGDAVSLSDVDNVQLANVVVSGEVGNAFTAFGASGLNVNGFTVASVTGNGLSLTDVDGAQLSNIGLSLDGGDAVSLSDTDNVQLANVVVSGEVGNAFTAFGASGLNVNGFSVASVTGSGIALTEVDGAQFANVGLTLASSSDAVSASNVSDLSLNGISLTGSFANGISLTEASNVTIANATISGGTGDGIVASEVSGLSISSATISDVGGDGIFVSNATDVAISGSDISATGNHGIQLETVDGALIAQTRIHNLARCEDNTDCEWSIFNPNVVYNAGISALAVENLTVRDVAMEDVTYGLFLGSQYEEIDWENTVVGQSGNLTVENLAIINSRREGVLLVGVEGASVQGLAIDNSAMDRSMDLIVLQKSSDITLDDLTLKGGINGLMFASSFNLPGDSTNISVSNMHVEDTYRSGVFMNPTTNVSFSNVTIVGPGSYGFHLYGDAWGFAGGPITGVSFDNVSVSNSADSAVYISGPIANFNGNITTENVPSACSADGGSWSGTELTQDAGNVFSIGGATLTPGTLNAACGL